ncbi:MAG: hypothetical protein QOI67_977, partial [Gaiellaceae bacterium]|nr:hypothetical protein [Gaiellaceae bacterium]
MTTSPPPPLVTLAEFERACGRPLITRERFAEDVGRAVAAGSGYAAGKLGVSERAWTLLPILESRGVGALQLRAFEQALKVKATRQAGVFPAELDFYREFASFYAGPLRELDCLGLSMDSFGPSLEIIRFYSLGADLIRYHDQEPDRSIPANDELCYLPHFEGERVLLVCPFAEVLRERATKETFEAVWAGTGKRWFEPASVEAVEFPYGFARETWRRFDTCLDLLDDITARMDTHDYDVALIAAAALGVPIASHARSRGKVGLSLGGALQVLFGVSGSRWR